MSLSDNLHMGAVALTIADLERSLAYYRQRLGLQLHRRTNGVAALGAGGSDLLLLHEQSGAHPARGTTGLFHFALLVPSRLDLAITLRHLIDSDVPIGGASDHAVSEALYLTDPDGHGIEIYRDRPRSEWEYPHGNLRLVTEPFDAQGVLAELGRTPPAWNGLPAGTVMGHVHLHVDHIPAAEQFYLNVLGFELVARYGRVASFVAAGGYHHHLGLNTWAGVGAPPPPAEAARLLWYEIVLPDQDALQAAADRLRAAGHAFTETATGLQTNDPAHNTIHLVTQQKIGPTGTS